VSESFIVQVMIYRCVWQLVIGVECVHVTGREDYGNYSPRTDGDHDKLTILLLFFFFCDFYKDLKIAPKNPIICSLLGV